MRTEDVTMVSPGPTAGAMVGTMGFPMLAILNELVQRAERPLASACPEASLDMANGIASLERSRGHGRLAEDM